VAIRTESEPTGDPDSIHHHRTQNSETELVAVDDEPLWKTVLNWGVIAMFFTMPLIVMCVQIYALSHPKWLSQQLPQSEFKHLIEFQRYLAFLVFGLSGLRTWEHMRNGKHNGAK
jgi:hypothetical protein